MWTAKRCSHIIFFPGIKNHKWHGWNGIGDKEGKEWINDEWVNKQINRYQQICQIIIYVKISS